MLQTRAKWFRKRLFCRAAENNSAIPCANEGCSQARDALVVMAFFGLEQHPVPGAAQGEPISLTGAHLTPKTTSAEMHVIVSLCA